LTEAQEELNRLAQVLAVRMGPVAPGLLHLKEAVAGCRTLAQQILERKGPPPSKPAGSNTAMTGEAASAPSVRACMPTTREEVYRQLAQAAAVLQQLEPHSPIPYLIQRAVVLGALPFPHLIKALIREPNVLAEINRELGISEEGPPTTT
jgi:type VI secretion system protein ImpA